MRFTVKKAYSLVLCLERQAEVSGGKNNTTQPEVAEFAVKTTSWEAESKDGGPRFGKCNKTNHTTKNCRAHLKCTFCGWKGHFFGFWLKRKTAFESEQSRPFSSKGNQVATHDKREVMPNFPFSQEDCKQILQMLNRNKSSFANQVGNSSNHKNFQVKLFLSHAMTRKKFGFWIVGPQTISFAVLIPSHLQDPLKTILLNYQMAHLLKLLMLDKLFSHPTLFLITFCVYHSLR